MIVLNIYNFIFNWLCIDSFYLLFIENKSLWIGKIYYISDLQNLLNFNISIYIDKISLTFIVLSILIIYLVYIWHYYVAYKVILFGFILLNIIMILIQLFFNINLILFFIFFEIVAIPLFFIINLWGSRERKVYASLLLLLFTLVGSIFILIAFNYFYLSIGSLNYIYIQFINYCSSLQILIFICIFLGFAIKIPLAPVHLWLPEAHVEAPTGGSVILAGIILKLAYYAYVRILLFLPYGWSYWLMLIIVLLIFSFFLPSLVALVQYDFKKIIAYSSIAHMNFALIGFFLLSLVGNLGVYIMMVGHAITSSGLFFLVGGLYERYKTRFIYYFGGLMNIMPKWSYLLFIFILSNFGFPGTINFVGEFLIFIGIFFVSIFVVILLSPGLIFVLMYSLTFFVKMTKGQLENYFIKYYCDLTRKEFYVTFLLIILCIFFGIFPNYLVDFITNYIELFILFLN